jgi:predicted anti-sigma-YlaC factor YlaD
MNCMETRALVEDALDESLSGNQRRALDLHLSRCDKCREFFATEREEHRRWFQAMNEPQARRRLPDGFAGDFLAAMAKNGNAPQKMWKFARLFRRIAAALAKTNKAAGKTPAAFQRSLSYVSAAAVLLITAYRASSGRQPHPDRSAPKRQQ